MQSMLRITFALAMASMTFAGGCSKLGSSGSEDMSSLLGAITSNPQLSTLAGLVGSADLGGLLSGTNPLTMLAPSNDAFAKMDPTALADLKKPENVGQLSGLLKSHIIPGKLDSDDLMEKGASGLMTMFGDKPLTAAKTEDGKVTVGGATVTETIDAGNGTIHVIDKVLMPTG
jgi:uncharacterized surface protein with fasciclin (FAS1) repeats